MPQQTRKPVGADLIIPAAAAGYAIYYVWSVRDFPFEAQISGIALAGLVGLFVLLYLARIAVGFRRRQYTMGFGNLFGPSGSRTNRAIFFGLIIGYIVVVRQLGFTLTTFVFLAGSFLVLGVQPRWKALLVAAVASIVGWLFFIVLLQTRFPQGPFERILGGLF